MSQNLAIASFIEYVYIYRTYRKKILISEILSQNILLDFIIPVNAKIDFFYTKFTVKFITKHRI